MSLPLLRLASQRLAGNPCDTPQQAVAWLGAVQAQDYSGAKWSLGLRVKAATEASIERACDAGEVLRTHVMRPTWHFVAPADIRWMQALTAPRVRQALAYGDRLNEIDEALRRRSQDVFAKALQGGQALTRAELASALAQAGIQAGGQRMVHLVMHAELDALLCSGPRRGKHFTYMLLDERAPHADPLPRAVALAGLARRYFTGHGPATARDFAWWSGLTLADAQDGLHLAAPYLVSEKIDGQACWLAQDTPPNVILRERLRRDLDVQRPKDPAPASAAGRAAYLLPTFDEYFVGYAGFDRARRGGPDAPGELRFESTLVLDGQVVGSWRRTLKEGAVLVELAPFAPLSPAGQASVEAAARRYGEFLGTGVVLSSENEDEVKR